VPRVALRANQAPAHVEDFPEGSARSCSGALHLLPGSYRLVTEDEAKHLLQKFGAARLDVITGPPAGTAPAPPAPPATEEAPTPHPSATVDKVPPTDAVHAAPEPATRPDKD
jgi:hypothetical protein